MGLLTVVACAWALTNLVTYLVATGVHIFEMVALIRAVPLALKSLRSIREALPTSGSALDVDVSQPTSDVQIFINYRSNDEPFGAALLDHALSEQFGTDRIFRAAKSIQPGDDFVNALLTGVRRSAIVLAVIGPRWSMAIDPSGQRQGPGTVDWARCEIAEAFRHGVRVIPVLLDVDLPSEADLPPDIAPLARCQYVRICHRSSGHDIEYLAQQLTRLVPGLVVASSLRPATNRAADHSPHFVPRMRRKFRVWLLP